MSGPTLVVSNDNPVRSLDQRTAEERAEAARIAAQTTEEWLADYDAASVYGEDARRLTPKQEGGQ